MIRTPVFAAALTFLFATTAAAQDAESTESEVTVEETESGHAGCKGQCKGHGEGHGHGHGEAMRSMMEEMDAMDARVDTLLAAVHDAGKKEREDAIVALLDELVAQRTAARARHQQMRHMMMGGGEGKKHECKGEGKKHECKGDCKGDCEHHQGDAEETSE